MYEGTKRLLAQEPRIRRLIDRHRLIPALPVGWDRLRLWTGAQLAELLAIVKDSGPRTARAALSARLFWEAGATARRFAVDRDAVTLFMKGAMKDAEDVARAMQSLANHLEPGLREQVKRDVTYTMSAPVTEFTGGKTMPRWPFGKQLASTDSERDFYDSIGAILNKHAHASPFFVLAPREDDAVVWFLVCRAIEQAMGLVDTLHACAAYEASR